MKEQFKKPKQTWVPVAPMGKGIVCVRMWCEEAMQAAAILWDAGEEEIAEEIWDAVPDVQPASGLDIPQ